jgi:hypothetical protein
MTISGNMWPPLEHLDSMTALGERASNDGTRQARARHGYPLLFQCMPPVFATPKLPIGITEVTGPQ